MESEDPKLPTERVAEKQQDSKRILAILTRMIPPILILAVGWFGYAKLSEEEEEAKRPKGKPRPVKTQVVELVQQDYQTKIMTQGNVRPHDQITLNSEVSGRVVWISPSFEDGAFFEEGDILVELDTADFEAAVANAEAQVARTTAAYALEKAQADVARANWEKLNLDEEPDPLVLRLPQLKQAEANVKSAEAQLGRMQRDLERARIRAPFDGRVRSRSVGLGQAIRINTPLGTIFASDYAEIRLPISAADLPMLFLPEDAADPPVDVELRDALNPDNSTVWPAQIIRTEGTLDANSLELFAIAKVDNPFGLNTAMPPLRVGQPVTASISGKVLQSVMAIPRIAVKRLDQIYLINPKKMTLHTRTIDALWTDEKHVIVRDPNIPDGSLLATTRLSYAPEGARVEILPTIDPDAVPTTTMLDTSTTKQSEVGLKSEKAKQGGKKSQ